MKVKELYIGNRQNLIHEDGSVSFTNPRSKEQVTTFGSAQNGYRQIRIGGKSLFLHRLVAMAFLGDYSESLQVDHINGVKHDNRVENLRMLTNQQQARAYQPVKAGSTSQYRGVSLYKLTGKWAASIRVNGKQQNLGHFTCEREAAKAYDAGAIKYGYLPEALNFKA